MKSGGGFAPVMLIERSLLYVAELLSVTLAVNETTPAGPMGVPVIEQVWDKDNPVGNVPV
jgi:hypothetical protein